jgi:hypothetical protein
MPLEHLTRLHALAPSLRKLLLRMRPARLAGNLAISRRATRSNSDPVSSQKRFESGTVTPIETAYHQNLNPLSHLHHLRLISLTMCR